MKRTRWIASEVGGRDDVIWIGDVGWGGGFSGGFAPIQVMIYIWNGGIGEKRSGIRKIKGPVERGVQIIIRTLERCRCTST